MNPRVTTIRIIERDDGRASIEVKASESFAGVVEFDRKYIPDPTVVTQQTIIENQRESIGAQAKQIEAKNQEIVDLQSSLIEHKKALRKVSRRRR